MGNYWRVLRRFNRDIWLYLASWALIGFGFFGVQAVLMNLYLVRLGFGPEFIGLLNGWGMLIWAVFALPAGALGRRIGVRGSVILGMVLIALGNAMNLLVEGLPETIRAGWLLGCSAFTWFGVSFVTVNSVPYLMGLTSPEERNHAFSMQQVAIALMAFLGSVAAGIIPGIFSSLTHTSLDQTLPFRLALWFAPPTFFLSALAIVAARPILLDEKKSTSAREGRAPLKFLVFFGIVVFLQAAGAGISGFFNLYMDTGLSVPTQTIGTVMGLSQLLSVLAAMSAPLFLARWGSSRTHALATLGAGLFIVPLAAVAHWGVASAGLIGMNMMIAILSPSRGIFGQEAVSPQWRTISSAISTIGLALGFSVISAAGGYLIRSLGFQGFFWAGTVLGVSAALLLFAYLRTSAISREPQARDGMGIGLAQAPDQAPGQD